MSSVEYKNLELDYRMYQYIRNNAINNIYDALVELITNCVDAYSSLTGEKNIRIEYSPETRNLKVIDQATGLDSATMETAFLTVGTYLSDSSKRGHFSRGAKDISAIADITFTTIKDNKLSQCKILSNGTGAMLISDRIVVDDDRTTYLIANNGLHVNLDLIDTLDLSLDWNKLKYHYALRDILKDSGIIITTKDSTSESTLNYSFPDGPEKVVSMEYMVPYYNVPAKFEVWLDRDNVLNSNDDLKFSENGFLIKSFNTIYENSMFGSRFIASHPKIHMLTGTLTCDYINTLLKDYETNGPSSKNPIPIIDTSRLNGINKHHRFSKHLLRLPTERITYILSELQYESNNKDSKVNLAELMASMKNLHILGDEVFEKLGVNLVSDFYLKKLTPVPRAFRGSEDNSLAFSRGSISTKMKTVLEEIDTKAAKLEINFVEKTFSGKYEKVITNSGININIPLENSVIKRYLGTSADGFPGKDDTRFKIILADIITESFADILADNDQQNTDTTNMTSQEIIDNYNSNYDKYYDLYEKTIFDVILG